MKLPTTLQECFDIAAPHLLQQGRRAEIGGACLYRGPDGAKCAIGACIPDAIYDPEMEGKGVGQIVDRFPSLQRWWSLIVPLSELQEIHDEYHPSDWREQLEAFANDHDLDASCIE